MTKLLKITILTLLIVTAATAAVHAQKIGVKTNTLYWLAGGTVNFGAEVSVGPKWTVDAVITGNPWTFGPKGENRKIWHWTVQPEARHWFAEAFNGSFVGVHATFGSFDAGGIKLPLGVFPDLADRRFEGWMGGVGVSYGHQWYISPHWNLEATLGFGYLYLNYNRFNPQTSQIVETGYENVVKHYFGPTKIGVSFMYLFGSKK